MSEDNGLGIWEGLLILGVGYLIVFGAFKIVEKYNDTYCNSKDILPQFIDDTHYNCCIYETKLINNKYEKVKTCKGYDMKK